MLEIFNLTTANTILMKLTTIMYFHESVNRKALRVRNSFFRLNLVASLLKLLYKLDDIWGSIPWKTTQNRFKMIPTITSLKLEPKLLSSRIMWLYKAFHLVQNLRCKSKDVRARSLKTLWKMGYKNRVFCLYFWHLLSRLKNCKICHVLHWYASLVQVFLKFELIKAHLRSFMLFSAHL